MPPRPRSCRRRPACSALAPVLLLLAAGCEEPRHAKTNLSAPPPDASAPAPTPTPPPAEEKVQLREVLGKRTQDIRDAETELKKGGQVASQKITAKDPITLGGNAYVTIIGRTSIMQIEHALNLYHATNERYPKDTPEFMEQIIKANNIALPTLPYYQEYAYDPNEHKLKVIEYPDRKAQLQKQDDARYGR